MQISILQLLKIGKIRKYISTEAAKELIHSLVIFLLNYANAVLIGLPGVKFQQLQSVQNSAARLLTGTKYNEHINLFLESLHWLPIESHNSSDGLETLA